MEAKGDTGGLIRCQRHAKAIWALNQTQGLLRPLYELRNGAGGGRLMERACWKTKSEKEGRKREGETEKVGGTRRGKERGLEQEPGYTDVYCLLWFPFLTL